MKSSLKKVCAVVVFFGAALCGFAQGRGVAYVEDVYATDAYGQRVVIEQRIWDSLGDYNLSKEFQTKEGWLYGVGEASGNVNNEGAILIKREAQEAAFDQVAGQLSRSVERVHQDFRNRGQRDGLNQNDFSVQEAARAKIKGELPQASKQYCYKIDRGNGNVTYVVGVGINMNRARAIANKYMPEDYKAANNSDINRLLGD